jgi:hypothetical protein
MGHLLKIDSAPFAGACMRVPLAFEQVLVLRAAPTLFVPRDGKNYVGMLGGRSLEPMQLDANHAATAFTGMRPAAPHPIPA